jgi:transposase
MALHLIEHTLSDQEWDLIKHLVPEAKPSGCLKDFATRKLFNAIFYLLCSGYFWRL